MGRVGLLEEERFLFRAVVLVFDLSIRGQDRIFYGWIDSQFQPTKILHKHVLAA